MGQSVRRKIKRGSLKMIWNATLNTMDFFKKTSNGRFIQEGPGHHRKTLDKWEKEA